MAQAIRRGGADARQLTLSALQACERGEPAEALALARDFHCLSGGDSALEDAAHELFCLAYRALGRHKLAEIATVHHRYRSLPRVDSYKLAEGD